MKSRRNTNSILSFEASGQLFGVPLQAVEGVSRLAEVISLPGNMSRVRLGVSYILGKIMIVVDCAPLVNKGNATNAREAVILLVDGGYYALLADRVGSIISKPLLKHPSKTVGDVIESVATYEKRSLLVIAPAALIHSHICN